MDPKDASHAYKMGEPLGGAQGERETEALWSVKTQTLLASRALTPPIARSRARKSFNMVLLSAPNDLTPYKSRLLHPQELTPKSACLGFAAIMGSPFEHLDD
jgi:hypothetical protein